MLEPLGSTTKTVSAPRENRARRYRLQDIAARLLPEERVSWCSHRLAHGELEVWKNGEKSFARGVARCGSVWLCPTCASKISEERREELKRAAAVPGYSMLLVTITLAHSREDRLSELLDALNEAWRRTRAGRVWKRFEEKYRLSASVSSLEITYSKENGYHPHKHVIMWSSLPEAEINVQEFERELSERWRAMLEKFGRYGSEFWSVKVSVGEKPTGAYLAKWGVIEEATKSQEKSGSHGHFTMWEVLRAAGDGEGWAVACFREYAAASHGRRWLVWSRGARALFGLGVELPDAEIAENENTSEAVLVCTVHKNEFRLVAKYRAICGLLEAAEDGGAGGVMEFLDRLRDRENEQERIEQARRCTYGL